MKSLLLLLLGTVLIWMGCGGSSYVTQDIYLTHQGFVELSKGNYSVAEANLLVSLDIKPNNPYSLLNLGAVYQDTGRAWQAVEMYEKLLELNPEQTAIQSNKEKYRGRSLVEIAKENLRSLAVNDAAKGSILGPFDMEDSVIMISDRKTLFTASKDHLPSTSDTTAINASALHVEGKQQSIALTLNDGPSDIGISAIGASAGAPGGGSGGGSSGGGGSGDGGSGGEPASSRIQAVPLPERPRRKCSRHDLHRGSHQSGNGRHRRRPWIGRGPLPGSRKAGRHP